MLRFSRLKIAMVVLFIVITVGTAYSYNIYNNTSDIVFFAYDNACLSDDDLGCYQGIIKPGNNGSCPGNDFGCGSNAAICFCLGSSCPHVNTPSTVMTVDYCWTGSVVPAHGWVEVSGAKGYPIVDCSQFTCNVFDANGNNLYSGQCQDQQYEGEECLPYDYTP